MLQCLTKSWNLSVEEGLAEAGRPRLHGGGSCGSVTTTSDDEGLKAFQRARAGVATSTTTTTYYYYDLNLLRPKWTPTWRSLPAPASAAPDSPEESEYDPFDDVPKHDRWYLEDGFGSWFGRGFGSGLRRGFGSGLGRGFGSGLRRGLGSEG